MMRPVHVCLGMAIRSRAVKPNLGNHDWKELVHPEKYQLKQTQNLYIAVHDQFIRW